MSAGVVQRRLSPWGLFPGFVVFHRLRPPVFVAVPGSDSSVCESPTGVSILYDMCVEFYFPGIDTR